MTDLPSEKALIEAHDILVPMCAELPDAMKLLDPEEHQINLARWLESRAAAEVRVRNEALEEAAEVADKEADIDGSSDYVLARKSAALDIAKEIRARKNPEPQNSEEAAIKALFPQYMTNEGHGHVWARPDGMLARCGGPGMCKICSADAATLAAAKTKAWNTRAKTPEPQSDGLAGELAMLIANATAGDLTTSEATEEGGFVECPMCGGQGEVEQDAHYNNFDSVALGVQFYGIGKHFGAHERLWSFFMKHRKTILAALSQQDAVREAARDVIAERERQQSVEGWTTKHDDKYRDGAMALAAACYALVGSGWKKEAITNLWPRSWSYGWFKSTSPRRDLVKAGALILAEIERLDRQALSRTGDA